MLPSHGSRREEAVGEELPDPSLQFPVPNRGSRRQEAMEGVKIEA